MPLSNTGKTPALPGPVTRNRSRPGTRSLPPRAPERVMETPVQGVAAETPGMEEATVMAAPPVLLVPTVDRQVNPPAGVVQDDQLNPVDAPGVAEESVENEQKVRDLQKKLTGVPLVM